MLSVVKVKSGVVLASHGVIRRPPAGPMSSAAGWVLMRSWARCQPVASARNTAADQ